MEKKGNVFTAGVFDLFHAGHMESIMRILDNFPDRNIIIDSISNCIYKGITKALKKERD